MWKEVEFKYRDQFIQLGITISIIRKMRGLSQEQLAEKAGISRSLLSAIEAPNMAKSFSLETLFNIATALNIAPEELLSTTKYPYYTDML